MTRGGYSPLVTFVLQVLHFLAESRYGDSHNEGKREVLRVVRGGTPDLQGTWMDEKLALKFAPPPHLKNAIPSANSELSNPLARR